MRKFIHLGFWFILLIPAVSLGINVAVQSSVTLVLPSDGSQYTLLGGDFDSLTVNNTDFSFSLPEFGKVEITSADKKNLTNSLNKATMCEATQSRIFLSVPSGGSTQTVTITPSGNCSTATSGSSGGGNPSIGESGGGGGGGSVAAAPAPAPSAPTPTTDKVALLKSQIAQIQSKISAIQTQSSQAGLVFFVKDMNFGERGEDIRKLQELLKQDKEIYPEGKVTGYFGPATLKAVRNFQTKYSLPAVGRVGPLTRQKLAQIFGSAKKEEAVSPVTPKIEVKPSEIAAPKPSSSQIQSIQEQIKALQTKVIQEQIRLIQEKLKALQK